MRDWSDMLSLGEQQRLTFARVIAARLVGEGPPLTRRLTVNPRVCMCVFGRVVCVCVSCVMWVSCVRVRRVRACVVYVFVLCVCVDP